MFDKMMTNNHMVFKTTGNVKSLTFQESTEILYLSKDSQPFIGDLNGDYIDDIIYNNVNGKSGKLEVAIFNSKTGVYDVSNFKDTMVDPTCGGVNSKVTNPSLTTPLSVSMIDFDGDCLSDLFLTIQDDDNPSKKYYEIYTRQEQKEESSKTKTKGSGLQSFCLV